MAVVTDVQDQLSRLSIPWQASLAVLVLWRQQLGNVQKVEQGTGCRSSRFSGICIYVYVYMEVHG